MDREDVTGTMETGKRRLLLNWCAAHGELKRLVESGDPDDGMEIGNGRGWTYLTFFPKGTRERDILYDIDQILILARNNNYHLSREVITQHNKIVLTAYPEGASQASILTKLYSLVASFAIRFSDTLRYPSHGFYGKFGGIYERPEKGRVLAVYSQNDDALLSIYESLEKLVSEIPANGLRFDLRFSNGLSALPRMLHGFDDPDYRRSGAKDYRITDSARFAILLEQAKQDYEKYLFDHSAIQTVNK
ncbi:MAG: hypothetical protein NT047_04435 [Deltaproteobacteria bacterium]|nr:hypothetical protein [Deltaproteobacteria bacterium]